MENGFLDCTYCVSAYFVYFVFFGWLSKLGIFYVMDFIISFEWKLWFYYLMKLVDYKIDALLL